jgi:enoyl-CoA hydratase/3-hydroxyacyl-CoA dehydrogenase
MNAPTLRDVEDVTVVGAGSMGHGIAQVFATAGYEVTLVDVEEEPLGNALERIESSLQQLGENIEAVLQRITTTTDRVEGLSGADVMVEAVPEDIDIKEAVFADADEVLPEHAVLATNTSTLPITEIAAATDRPERVVGMHFSNPVPLMEIVEVISGEQTSEPVLEFTEALSEDVGKTPVVLEKDVPGFLLNRINYAFWSEALRRVDAGEQDVEAIDASIQRLGFPMGPFEVLDFAGVDVFYLVCQAMQDRGVPVEISDTHEALFEAGKYGMKTGAGFYEYPEPGTYTRADIPLEKRYEYNPYYMIASAVNAAAWLLENDVATKEDIDAAMEIGMSWPRGPLEMADEYGLDRIVSTLEQLYHETGWEQYKPQSLLEEMVEEGQLGVKSGAGFYKHDQQSDSFDHVDYDRRGFYGVITVSRPEEQHTLNEQSWQGLRAALKRAREDDDIHATIIRGGGDAFSAGGNIAELAATDSNNETSTVFETEIQPTVEELWTHPKPTITLVDGDATGIGCELALLSDMAVAAEGSYFGQPEATSGGLSPIWLTHGATSVGKKKVLELAMTENRLSAREAEEIGLVTYTVSADQAQDVARELARSTKARDSASLRAIKEIWNGMEDEMLDDWLARATDKLSASSHTEDG